MKKYFLLSILFLAFLAYGIEKKTPSGGTVKDKPGQSQETMPGQFFSAIGTYSSQVGPVPGTYYDDTTLNIKLNKGTYLLIYIGSIGLNAPNGTVRPAIALYAGTSLIEQAHVTTTSLNGTYGATIVRPYTIIADGTVIKGKYGIISGSFNGALESSKDLDAKLYAVRLGPGR